MAKSWTAAKDEARPDSHEDEHRKERARESVPIYNRARQIFTSLLLLLFSEEAADCILRASVQNLLRARHFSQSALGDAACDSCHVWNDVRARSGSLDGKRNAALAAA